MISCRLLLSLSCIASRFGHLQAKFGTPADDFAKWRFSFVSRNQAELLQADNEVVYDRFYSRNYMGLEQPYLGIENDDKPKRAHQHRYTTFDKPVKINC